MKPKDQLPLPKNTLHNFARFGLGILCVLLGVIIILQLFSSWELRRTVSDSYHMKIEQVLFNMSEVQGILQKLQTEPDPAAAQEDLIRASERLKTIAAFWRLTQPEITYSTQPQESADISLITDFWDQLSIALERDGVEAAPDISNVILGLQEMLDTDMLYNDATSLRSYWKDLMFETHKLVGADRIEDYFIKLFR